MTRIEWARLMMRQAPDAPVYGTEAWLALPDGPEKVAAVVRAAECWITDGEEFTTRLQIELDYERAATKAEADSEFVARAQAHRASWIGTGFRRDPARDAEVEAEWREWISDAS